MNSFLKITFLKSGYFGDQNDYKISLSIQVQPIGPNNVGRISSNLHTLLKTAFKRVLGLTSSKTLKNPTKWKQIMNESQIPPMNERWGVYLFFLEKYKKYNCFDVHNSIFVDIE